MQGLSRYVIMQYTHMLSPNNFFLFVKIKHKHI